MAERDETGRFVKGHPGGPGRPKKEREERFYEITLSAVTFGDWKEIINKAVSQAKRGDSQARKFLADYLIGPPVQKSEITGAESGALEIIVRYAENDRTNTSE